MNAKTQKRMLLYGTVALGGLLLYMFGSPSDEPSEAAVSAPAGAHPARHGTAVELPAATAAFLTRLAHRTTDGKNASALFATHSWYVPPPPPPPPPPPGPPPPPTAPPLPFTLIGSYAAQGDQETYFLSRGDRIYDVKVGDVIDPDYSLQSASGGTLTFLYKPLDARQTLSLGGST
jgi:hypothetical protein